MNSDFKQILTLFEGFNKDCKLILEIHNRYSQLIDNVYRHSNSSFETTQSTSSNTTESNSTSRLPQMTRRPSASTNIQRSSPSTNIQRPSPSTNIQRPSPSTNIQRPSPSTNIQRPSASTNIQRPSASTNIVQDINIRNNVSESQDIKRDIKNTNIINPLLSDISAEMKYISTQSEFDTFYNSLFSYRYPYYNTYNAFLSSDFKTDRDSKHRSSLLNYPYERSYRRRYLRPTRSIDNLTNVIVKPSQRQIHMATQSMKYRELKSEQQLRCPIDKELLLDDDEIMIIKKCKHVFRKSNITKWFEQNAKCPLCRYDIRDYIEV